MKQFELLDQLMQSQSAVAPLLSVMDIVEQNQKAAAPLKRVMGIIEQNQKAAARINNVRSSIDLLYNKGIWVVLEDLKKYDTITEAITAVHQNYSWIYDIKADIKKGKKVSNGKARQIEIGSEKLRATNQVLGLVCYYAGYDLRERIKETFESKGIKLHPNAINEIVRYRNSFNEDGIIVFKNKKPTTKKYSARMICIYATIEIQKKFSINGKTKAQEDLKKLKNYHY